MKKKKNNYTNFILTVIAITMIGILFFLYFTVFVTYRSVFWRKNYCGLWHSYDANYYWVKKSGQVYSLKGKPREF